VTDLAAAAALVLAAVFAWAGVAKLRHAATTTASFTGLGLPAPAVLARAVPLIELVVGAGLVFAPAFAAWIALALLLAFTVVIGRAVTSGSTVSCACFGSGAGSEDDRPVSALELVRNAGLGGLAIVAGGAGAGAVSWPALPALVIVTVLVALARVAFAAVELRRLGGHVWSTPLPGDGLR
jgi:uncharacterized membrane protein YphA (DoxX/SURF4 family)